jgi:hypothetical protein
MSYEVRTDPESLTLKTGKETILSVNTPCTLSLKTAGGTVLSIPLIPNNTFKITPGTDIIDAKLVIENVEQGLRLM